MDMLVLTVGENHQGGSVRGVFCATANGIALADQAIDEIRERESYGDWERDDAALKHGPTIRAYRFGCDWVRLVSFKVQG